MTPWWGYVLNGGGIGGAVVLLVVSDVGVARVLGLIGLACGGLALGIARRRDRASAGVSS